jgi:hypothetical protein
LIRIDRFTQSDNKSNYGFTVSVAALTTRGISERISLTEFFIKRKQQEYLQLSDELAINKADSIRKYPEKLNPAPLFNLISPHPFVSVVVV